MGWFGYSPMDGDDGMDLRDKVFSMIGVKLDNYCNCITSDGNITKLLDENQDMICDWLRDYDFSSRFKPCLIQEAYIQAYVQTLLDYNVKISERVKKVATPFIINDTWASKNKDRKEAMDKLLAEVEAN